jgi:peroxiredoxin
MESLQGKVFVRRAVFQITLPLLLFLPTTALTGSAAAQSGDLAPAFTVKDLDGRTFRLQDYRGKPVVLDFWASWCRPCRTSMPHLDVLQQRYRNQGLVILGLSLDDYGNRSARRFAEQLRVRFRLAMANERVLDLYGPIRSVPTTIFINRRGEVVRRVVGYIDGETLETYARELF